MAIQTQKTAVEKKKGAVKGLLRSEKADASQETTPGSEEKHQMIAKEAYRIAEQRGFHGDKSLEDWLQAEAIINAKFEAKH